MDTVTSPEPPVIERMQALIARWEEQADPRSVFLSCYLLMTRNMLSAIDRGEFTDPAWADRLLHRFADYYFVALDAYEQQPALAPTVWQLAFDATRDTDLLALQKLLLGVNAHINYDLVLTLAEILKPEWAQLSEDQRGQRYADHCHVNDVIAGTIDAVQDQVLEPAMPVLDIVDRLLGPMDERMVSRTITQWRDKVWQHAMLLLDTSEPDEQARLIRQVEVEALRRAGAITLTDLPSAIDEFL